MMKRRFLQVLILGCVAAAVAAACLLPFYYETQTLWYKTGWDKILLRAGHVCGMLALVSLLLQLVLGSRGRMIEESFGIAAVMRWHRLNGVLLLLLALLHITLVLLPEGLANLPIGVEFWPEMVGGVLVVVIFWQAFTSSLRQRLGLDYRRWRVGHRLIGYLTLLLVTVHILFVADSFAQGLPRTALVVVVGLVVARIILVKRAAARAK
jgi:predicted ferric reductase